MTVCASPHRESSSSRRRRFAAFAVVPLLLALACTPSGRVATINATNWISARTLADRGAGLQRRLDFIVPSGTVLFVGDSLASQNPSRLIGSRVVTFGVGGDLIETVAARLRGRESLSRIAGLVVLAGTNDIIHRRPGESETALRALLTSLPPALPVWICTVPPIDPAAHTERTNEAVAAWNARLPRLVAERPGTRIIATNRALADPSGNLPAAWHQGDGLHLSLEGKKRLAGSIREALESAGLDYEAGL